MGPSDLAACYSLAQFLSKSPGVILGFPKEKLLRIIGAVFTDTISDTVCHRPTVSKHNKW